MGKRSAPPPPDYRGAAQEQAAASREITEQQTWANRPTQITPWGRVDWSRNRVWDPATRQYLNEWTQETSLDPELEAALGSQQQLQRERSELGLSLTDRMRDEYGQPMDWSALPEFGAAPDVPQYGLTEDRGALPTAGEYTPEEIQRQVDLSGLQDVDPTQRYYQDAIDASYGQFEQRMEPRFERQSAALENRLRNQGLRPGDEAYDVAMQEQYQNQEDARRMASREATLMGGQEAQRMYGMDMGLRGQQYQELMGAGGFANEAARQAFEQQMGLGGRRFGEEAAIGEMQDARRSAEMREQLGLGGAEFSQGMDRANYDTRLRQQQMAEEMQRRGFSLNEINALLYGQQVGMPSMPSFSQAQRSETPQLLNAANMGWNASMDRFGAEQAQQQALWGGLTDIGKLAMGF